MTLPLWLSQDQADRLKSALEALGFENVTVESMTTYGEPDGRLQVTGRHIESGDGTHALAGDASGLQRIVSHFEAWKGRRNAD